jgi:hypothetical protein
MRVRTSGCSRVRCSNRGALVDRWNRATGTQLGGPWCGNFVNACLMAAGFPAEPWMKLCAAIEGNARAGKGGWSWVTAPRPGDLILFTVNGAANHVGIVEVVGAGTVPTIEGNTHKDYDPAASARATASFAATIRPGGRRSAATRGRRTAAEPATRGGASDGSR